MVADVAKVYLYSSEEDDAANGDEESSRGSMEL